MIEVKRIMKIVKLKLKHNLKFFLPDSNGDVRVNWATVTKNGTTLKTGDIVSVSGKGRLKVSLKFNELLFWKKITF